MTNAISHPRPLDLQRVDSKQARRVLDRLVGYKISPLLWAKVRKGLSAGRVQSVAAKMIVDREREIDAFVPEEFGRSARSVPTASGRSRCAFVGFGAEKTPIPDEQAANAAVKRLEQGVYNTVGICAAAKDEKTRPRRLPLQTFSRKRPETRFTTSKTMLIAQQLYEGVELKGEGAVGLVSYIRTDSTRISRKRSTTCAPISASIMTRSICRNSPMCIKAAAARRMRTRRFAPRF